MKTKKNYMIILSVIIMLIVLVISVSKLGSEIKHESNKKKSLEETVLEDIKEAKVETLDEGTVNVNGNMIAYTLNGSSTSLSWSTLTDGSTYCLESISCSTGSAQIYDKNNYAIKFTSVPAVCTVNFTTDCSCTVYCKRYYANGTGDIECSTTRPSGNVVYGAFTCYGLTGKTGSIESCYYGATQCNVVSVASTWFCTYSAGFQYGNIYHNCNNSLPSANAPTLGLDSSGYSCSC